MIIGHVYKVWAAADPANFVVGSTEKRLAWRLKHYRSESKVYPDMKKYAHLLQFPKETWKIQLVEDYECDTKKQLRMREEYWRVKLGATLNTNRAFLTQEHRLARNRLAAKRRLAKPGARGVDKERYKKYRQQNLDKTRACGRKSYHNGQARDKIAPFFYAAWARTKFLTE
jgi:hypothetical protein